MKAFKNKSRPDLPVGRDFFGIIESMAAFDLLLILTPRKYILDGLYYGPPNPQTVFIAVHGLGSSLFANHNLYLRLVNEQRGVLLFNNRGHDPISWIKKIDKRKKRGANSIIGGCAHEVFADCVDDIAGAVAVARSKNPKRIILIGHSTGCQKSIYFLAHSRKTAVDAVVLLAPISDYASFIKFTPPKEYETALRAARDLIQNGKPHQLLAYEALPQKMSESCDAQRFLSLYTPNSPEEIFCYAQKNKVPKDLQRVKIPLLILLAQNDEYRDRPMKQLATWFTRFNRSLNFRCEIIPNALHSFWDNEKEISTQILSFLSSI